MVRCAKLFDREVGKRSGRRSYEFTESSWWSKTSLSMKRSSWGREGTIRCWAGRRVDGGRGSNQFGRQPVAATFAAIPVPAAMSLIHCVRLNHTSYITVA